MADLIIEKFIGKGLVFPITLNGNGTPVLQTGFPLIESSLKNLLTWVFGTRFFLGEYGSRIETLISEPNDTLIQGIIKDLVSESIKKFETRIELLSSRVIQEDGALSLDISYRILNTQAVNSFIFPFYTKPTY